MCPDLFFVRQVSKLYNFRIKLGNIITDVQSNYSYIEKICQPYYSLEESNCKIIIDRIAVEDELRAVTADNQYPAAHRNLSEDWFLEVYALLDKLLPLLPRHNMLFMHGSAIMYKGKAYIFIAPSGTGKSTHARLWKERFGDDVTIINDDKPFLTFRADKVYVCGTPWRGKHNIGQNIECILGGICILTRGERNEICRVSPADAVQDVIRQSNLHRYKENTLLALELIDKLLQLVPVYHLACTATIDAVEICCKEILK